METDVRRALLALTEARGFYKVEGVPQFLDAHKDEVIALCRAIHPATVAYWLDIPLAMLSRWRAERGLSLRPPIGKQKGYGYTGSVSEALTSDPDAGRLSEAFRQGGRGAVQEALRAMLEEAGKPKPVVAPTPPAEEVKEAKGKEEMPTYTPAKISVCKRCQSQIPHDGGTAGARAMLTHIRAAHPEAKLGGAAKKSALAKAAAPVNEVTAAASPNTTPLTFQGEEADMNLPAPTDLPLTESRALVPAKTESRKITLTLAEILPEDPRSEGADLYAQLVLERTDKAYWKGKAEGMERAIALMAKVRP